MQAGHPISLLMFGTFAIVLLLAIVLLANFLRKRRNRHPLDDQPDRNIGEIRRDGGKPSD